MMLTHANEKDNTIQFVCPPFVGAATLHRSRKVLMAELGKGSRDPPSTSDASRRLKISHSQLFPLIFPPPARCLGCLPSLETWISHTAEEARNLSSSLDNEWQYRSLPGW